MNTNTPLRLGLMFLLFILVIKPVSAQNKPIAKRNSDSSKSPTLKTYVDVAQMISDSFGAPVSLVAEFIREAKSLETEEGIPAAAFIGIAILEYTGFTSYLYKQALNPFGMRATKIWHGPTFIMFHEGADSPFRKYNTPRAAVRDFKVFLASRKWFQDALLCPVTDIECFLKGMSANPAKREPGYASDPAWANKVRRVIKTYKLDALRE